MARPNDTSVDTSAVEAEVARIQGMSKYDLIVLWRRTFQTHPPLGFTKGLIGRYLAYHVQEKAFGGLDRKTENFLNALARATRPRSHGHVASRRARLSFVNMGASDTR